MNARRRWILLPVISTCLLIVAIWLPYLTGRAAWSIPLLVVLGVVDCVCFIVCNQKLRCPACGEPLRGIIYRYLFQKERGAYCSGCGQYIEIIK